MVRTSEAIALDDGDRAVLGAAKARMDEQTARLRDVVPCIIDMSFPVATSFSNTTVYPSSTK